jgi:hypothetical protein
MTEDLASMHDALSWIQSTINKTKKVTSTAEWYDWETDNIIDNRVKLKRKTGQYQAHAVKRLNKFRKHDSQIVHLHVYDLWTNHPIQSTFFWQG